MTVTGEPVQSMSAQPDADDLLSSDDPVLQLSESGQGGRHFPSRDAGPSLRICAEIVRVDRNLLIQCDSSAQPISARHGAGTAR